MGLSSFHLNQYNIPVCYTGKLSLYKYFFENDSHYLLMLFQYDHNAGNPIQVTTDDCNNYDTQLPTQR